MELKAKTASREKTSELLKKTLDKAPLEAVHSELSGLFSTLHTENSTFRKTVLDRALPLTEKVEHLSNEIAVDRKVMRAVNNKLMELIKETEGELDRLMRQENKQQENMRKRAKELIQRVAFDIKLARKK